MLKGAKMGDSDVEATVAVVEADGKVGLPRGIVDNAVGARAADLSWYYSS